MLWLFIYYYFLFVEANLRRSYLKIILKVTFQNCSIGIV